MSSSPKIPDTQSRQDSFLNLLKKEGFAFVRGVVDCNTIEQFHTELSRQLTSPHVKSSPSSLFAMRHAAAVIPSVRKLAYSAALRSIVDPVVGSDALLVKAMFFDKVRDANWKVPWHQDLMIAVNRRRDSDGFGPWTLKDGVDFVQPPIAILEQVLTLRVHLDSCDERNGALKVIPRSHESGCLNEHQIKEMCELNQAHVCRASAGDVLVMRPLLLHSSSPATQNLPRRILHLEYTAVGLPDGLGWYEA